MQRSKSYTEVDERELVPFTMYILERTQIRQFVRLSDPLKEDPLMTRNRKEIKYFGKPRSIIRY